jgi:hypothetical protein
MTCVGNVAVKISGDFSGTREGVGVFCMYVYELSPYKQDHVLLSVLCSRHMGIGSYHESW